MTDNNVGEKTATRRVKGRMADGNAIAVACMVLSEHLGNPVTAVEHTRAVYFDGAPGRYEAWMVGPLHDEGYGVHYQDPSALKLWLNFSKHSDGNIYGELLVMDCEGDFMANPFEGEPESGRYRKRKVYA